MEDGPGYTGHVTDAATGLVYMQQRYYDPVVGRFLSRDEVTAYEKPLTNFNSYVYANVNPYRFKDLDGRQSYENLNFSGQLADQMLREGKITPEQHMEMWNSGAAAGAKGIALGMAIADGAALARGGIARLASLRATQGVAREFSISSAQLGKKLGGHVEDFGGNPASAADRAAVTKLINEIGRNPAQVASGVWRGLGEGGKVGPAEFRIKGADVVVTTPKGDFVTILKDGINNKFVQAAIRSSE
jgi:RHS repeat-associated protein